MSPAQKRARALVHFAAQPVEPGEKISAQKARAFRRLHMQDFGKAADSMLSESWYGRAGEITYARLLDQAIRVGLVRLEFASERTPADPEFHSQQVIGMKWRGDL